jgi:SAM-dependent methyltransferase
MSRSSEMRKSKAVELASRYTPNCGRILEVSCGSGNELLKLQQAGYEVTGTNYTKYENESPNVKIRHGVDLLQGLPFEDESFDTVLLLDVIEHLANHDKAVSELARVCKAMGHVIIMTPNIMKLTSRLHFLFTGFFKLKRAFIGFDVPLGSAFAFHNYPVHLPVFLYLLHAHGLSLSEFTASVYKKKSFFFYLLLWPFIALATRLKLHFGERNLKDTEHAMEIGRILTSVSGLCGEFFFTVACKRGASPAEGMTALPKWSAKWEKEETVNNAMQADARTSHR